MPLFDVKCPKCSWWSVDRLIKADGPTPLCELCDTPTEKLLSTPAPPVFGKGRSAESHHTWQTREREKLTTRSAQYDKSPQGKELREKSAEHMMDKLSIPKTLLK